MKSRAALAASFVVTVAASACSSSSTPADVPPDPVWETGNPPQPVEPQPEAERPRVPAPEEPDGSEQAELGPDEHIKKRPDGTCYAYAAVECPPPPATCNPPPPRQVACPNELDEP
jgi:hypothetical protein